MSSEGTRSEEDLEELRRQKELIELKAQIAALRAPWWRRASLIATITGIAAAVIPLTTAIQEHYRNEREYSLQRSKQDGELALQQSTQETEIRLQQAKQEHDIRIAYLDRFEIPGKRFQTLRFLLATSTDARLLAWAQEEIKMVEGQLLLIDQKLADVEKKIEQAPAGGPPPGLKSQPDHRAQHRGPQSRNPAPPAGPAPPAEELKSERDHLEQLRGHTSRQPAPAAVPAPAAPKAPAPPTR